MSKNRNITRTLVFLPVSRKSVSFNRNDKMLICKWRLRIDQSSSHDLHMSKVSYEYCGGRICCIVGSVVVLILLLVVGVVFSIPHGGKFLMVSGVRIEFYRTPWWALMFRSKKV